MPDHSPFSGLDTDADWQTALERSEQEPVVVYKHSSMCGISGRARRLLLDLTKSDDPPIFEVVVQQARALSNEIEAQLNVRHETPQVIILQNRKPIFSASHGRIQPEKIREYLAAENNS